MPTMTHSTAVEQAAVEQAAGVKLVEVDRPDRKTRR